MSVALPAGNQVALPPRTDADYLVELCGSYLDAAPTEREKDRRARILLAFVGRTILQMGTRRLSRALRCTTDINRQIGVLLEDLRAQELPHPR